MVGVQAVVVVKLHIAKLLVVYHFVAMQVVVVGKLHVEKLLAV